MHCAPFLLTMQIIFASVSYRRVVADLRVNDFTNPDLRQLTRGHDLVYALQVRLQELSGNDPWGYNGLCLMLRSRCCTWEKFEETDLYQHLNIWMEERDRNLWNEK